MERCHGWNGSSHIFEVHLSEGQGDCEVGMMVICPYLSHTFLPQNWELTFGASRILKMNEMNMKMNGWRPSEMMWAIHLWKHSLLIPLAWAWPSRPSLLDCLVLSGIKWRKTWWRVGWMEDNEGEWMSRVFVTNSHQYCYSFYTYIHLKIYCRT